MWSQHFGTGNLDTAKKCIAENLKRYVNADARTNPADFNLYNALKGIIDAVEALENKTKRLKRDLEDAQSEIDDLQRRLR
jgi:hypothetical protein